MWTRSRRASGGRGREAPDPWSGVGHSTDIVAFPIQPIEPLAALIAAIRLTLDNQDTRQVARLGIAITGRSQREVFERFAGSATGRRIIAERRSLVPVLDDHAFLGTLPENSLGRHYLAFMRREGLSAQGLVDATPDLSAHLAELPEPVSLFADYTQRGMHDIYHILTGYGRDELGETCVLAMAYEHLHLRVYKVIAGVGPFVVRKHLRRIGASPRGVFAAVREATRIGRQAAWLGDLDVEATLPEDLTALRARLNIAVPHNYQAVIAHVRAETAWRDGPFAP